MGNRDVAAALFLSPKTVEFHLTRVYQKLDVRSRTELRRLRPRTSPWERMPLDALVVANRNESLDATLKRLSFGMRHGLRKGSVGI